MSNVVNHRMKLGLIVIFLLSAFLVSCGEDSKKSKSKDKDEVESLVEEGNKKRNELLAIENELSLEGINFKKEGFGRISATYKSSNSIEQEEKVLKMLQNYSEKVAYYVNKFPEGKYSNTYEEEFRAKKKLAEDLAVDIRGNIEKLKQKQIEEEQRREKEEELQKKIVQKKKEFDFKLKSLSSTFSKQEDNLNNQGITFVKNTDDDSKINFASLEFDFGAAYDQAKRLQDKKYLYDLLEKVRLASESFILNTEDLYNESMAFIKNDKHEHISRSSKLKFIYELSKFTAVKSFVETYDEKVKLIDDLDVNNM